METIESQSQQDLLGKKLENYAEARRSNPVMSMLAEVTEAAVALADMQTQPENLLIAVDDVTVAAGKPAGHISKKMTVGTGEDGVRAGCPQMIDDYENTVYEDRTPNLASDDAMGRIEPRQQSWSEARGSQTVIDQNNDILQQIPMLCSTLRNLSSRMQEEFAAERNSRHEEHRKMEQKISAKMEESLRSERQARQLAQNEIMKGLKNEENATQMVQKDLAVMKEEIKNLKMGSGGTVCSEQALVLVLALQALL